ncbi:MAG: hypothetical protein IV085_09835 [Thiobacillus sp.]|nr:hypothetical protein [Thiobacillus sp.]
MKMTSLLTAACGAALLSASLVHAETPAAPSAETWTDTAEMADTADSVNMQEDSSTYIGTSLPEPRKRIYLEDPNTAFPNPDQDGSGYVVGTAEPEKGTGDQYGNVLFDVGVQP